MLTTARDIINTALLKVGAVSQGGEASEDQVGGAWRELKGYVEQLEANGFDVTNRVIDIIPINGAATSTTIGKTNAVYGEEVFDGTVLHFFINCATVAVTAAVGGATIPSSIDPLTGYITLTGASTGSLYIIKGTMTAPDHDLGHLAPEVILSASITMSGVDYDLNILSDIEYDEQEYKKTLFGIPANLYYEYDPDPNKYSTIRLWPVPSASLSLNILSRNTINIGSENSSVLEEIYRADKYELLLYGLCIRLAPTYGAKTSPEIAELYKEAMKTARSNRPHVGNSNLDIGLLKQRKPFSLMVTP